MCKLTILMFVILAGCNSGDTEAKTEMLTQKEAQLNEREKDLLELQKRIDSTSKLVSISEKLQISYVYVKIKTFEIKHVYDPIAEQKMPKGESRVFCSNIEEVENLTENKKAQLMDGFAFSVKGEIVDRKCMVFDSYFKASEDRFKNRDKF